MLHVNQNDQQKIYISMQLLIWPLSVMRLAHFFLDEDGSSADNGLVSMIIAKKPNPLALAPVFSGRAFLYDVRRYQTE